jgi:hypothetical protein
MRITSKGFLFSVSSIFIAVRKSKDSINSERECGYENDPGPISLPVLEFLNNLWGLGTELE